MAPFQPSTVIIAGGSLSSLMHALVLLSRREPPTRILILERSRAGLLHNQGAGIVASREVQDFFGRYFPECAAGDASAGKRDVVVRSRVRQYLARDGGVMEGSVEEREQRMTSWDLVYHLLRWRVDGLQSEYVGGLEPRGNEGERAVDYRNGCVVVGVEEVEDGKVRVRWQNAEGEEESDDADLLVGADGASSTVRRLMMPGVVAKKYAGVVERKYVGYVAWRGTVPEQELSEAAREVFVENFTFFHSEGTQSLGYLIPGQEGAVEPGKRLFNWVWYVNYEEGSPELDDLMTDNQGRRHNITLPVGGMQKHVWEKQKDYASRILPPQFTEAVAKTKQPFIQAITDVISLQNSFLSGKVLLVGDALAGFRPHTAASTGQAAYNALQLGRLLDGAIEKEGYDQLVMGFARKMQESGVVMGETSQFGKHPFAG